MITDLSITELIELKNLFEELVRTNKIRYVSFKKEKISKKKNTIKSKEHYEMMVAWFKIYEGQVIRTKIQIGYDDIMEAIKRPELIRLKHWVAGQKARLSTQKMQPHEYIILKLSGLEFQTKDKQHPVEDQMLEYIQNSNLSRFVITKDNEKQIRRPKRLILK